MSLQTDNKTGRGNQWKEDVRKRSSPPWSRHLHQSPPDFHPVEHCVSSVGAHLSCSVKEERIMQMIYGMLTILLKYVHFYMATHLSLSPSPLSCVAIKPHLHKCNYHPTHCDQWSWTGHTQKTPAFLIIKAIKRQIQYNANYFPPSSQLDAHFSS